MNFKIKKNNLKYLINIFKDLNNNMMQFIPISKLYRKDLIDAIK